MNTARGQTLGRVGTYLLQSVFSEGHDITCSDVSSTIIQLFTSSNSAKEVAEM